MTNKSSELTLISLLFLTQAQAAAETRTAELLQARQEEVEKLRGDLQNAVQDKVRAGQNAVSEFGSQKSQ